MSDLVLVDTDILVDVARGVVADAEYLAETKSQRALVISGVTEMELIVGCRNKGEVVQLDKFLSDFRRVRITPEICDEAVELVRRFRLSQGLLIPDALIAATAQLSRAALLTRNQRHYQHIPGINLLAVP